MYYVWNAKGIAASNIYWRAVRARDVDDDDDAIQFSGNKQKRVTEGIYHGDLPICK